MAAAALIAAAACAPLPAEPRPSYTPDVVGWTYLGYGVQTKCDQYGNILYIKGDRIVVIEKGCK